MNNNSNFSYTYPQYFNMSGQGSNYDQNDRLVGGFAFPFLLGGVTGAALAPNFWRPGFGYNRPFYPPRPPYPYPPYYGPYYR